MSVERRRQSARTLLVMSGAVILIGAAVLSPAAALACAALAGLAALGAVPLGSRRARLVALVLLALAAAMGVTAYPRYQSELQRIHDAAASDR